MPRQSVITRDRFHEVVNDLRDHSDFFDPFYLEGDSFEPLTKEYYTNLPLTEGFDAGEYWEVVDFIQSFSDVNLLEGSRLREDEDRFGDLVNNWYMMYLDAVTRGDVYGA